MSPDSIFWVAFRPVRRPRSRKAIHSRATAACSVSSSCVRCGGAPQMRHHSRTSATEAARRVVIAERAQRAAYPDTRRRLALADDLGRVRVDPVLDRRGTQRAGVLHASGGLVEDLLPFGQLVEAVNSAAGSSAADTGARCVRCRAMVSELVPSTWCAGWSPDRAVGGCEGSIAPVDGAGTGHVGRADRKRLVDVEPGGAVQREVAFARLDLLSAPGADVEGERVVAKAMCSPKVKARARMTRRSFRGGVGMHPDSADPGSERRAQRLLHRRRPLGPGTGVVGETAPWIGRLPARLLVAARRATRRRPADRVRPSQGQRPAVAPGRGVGQARLGCPRLWPGAGPDLDLSAAASGMDPGMPVLHRPPGPDRDPSAVARRGRQAPAGRPGDRTERRAVA